MIAVRPVFVCLPKTYHSLFPSYCRVGRSKTRPPLKLLKIIKPVY
jgi:hypothetical protein